MCVWVADSGGSTVTLKHSNGDLIWSRVGAVVGVIGLLLSVAGGAVGGIVSNSARDARIDLRIDALEQRSAEMRAEDKVNEARMRSVETDVGVIRAGVEQLLDAHQLREPGEK